jgi:branched-chain amino acid transport system permease protein
MTMRPINWLRWGMFTALLAGAAVFWLRAGYFGHTFLAELAIYVLLAISVDLVAGYAGLVSIAHAMFFALGAYGVGVATVKFGWNPWHAFAFSVAFAATVAAAVAAVITRVAGVFFMMVSLAVAEMFYALIFTTRWVGGSDGMPGIPRPELNMLGVNLIDQGAFAALAVILCFSVFFLLMRLVVSPFGVVLEGLHQNEARLLALGAPVARIKIAVFALAGGIAALAGGLLAFLNGFISPELGHWTISGIVLVMGLVGGAGTMVGAAIGAVIIHSASHLLSNVTPYWLAVIGVFFIGVVLYAPAGVYGALAAAATRLRR